MSTQTWQLLAFVHLETSARSQGQMFQMSGSGPALVCALRHAAQPHGLLLRLLACRVRSRGPWCRMPLYQEWSAARLFISHFQGVIVTALNSIKALIFKM
jgi:hypothetical protein